MAVNPILTSSAQGLERSIRQLDETAARIAAGTHPDSAPAKRDAGSSSSAPLPQAQADQLEALASLKLIARQVQAAAKVVETADATVGFLLDTHA